jgi:dephospho-CoA kinase
MKTTRIFSIGLTGGIGSGKSLVADLFAARGAAIVDTDVIAHSLTAPGGAAIEAIAAAFGAGFIDDSGAMDRARMRQTVFADPAARKKLEAILHPMIRAATGRAARLAAGMADAGPADGAVVDGNANGNAAAAAGTARAGRAPYLIYVVPLLVESAGWRNRVDRILVVDCPEAVQIERVMRRNGLPLAQVEAILAAQASRADRLAAADDVVLNDAGVDKVLPQVERLHATYLALAGAPAAE